MTFFGMYRGTVFDNVDPKRLGRVYVQVPQVLADKVALATPCAAFAGPACGLFAVPENEAPVWVQFEGGDPAHPIYMGGFWDDNHAPPGFGLGKDPTQTTQLTLLAQPGFTLTINTDPQSADRGLTISVGPPVLDSPLTLSCDSSGITLTNGGASVSLAPATVSINGDALQVT
jgi:hypothetical protein